MGESFVISDTHFGHDNTWKKFKKSDGITPLRPFESTEEMNEFMVQQWNAVVGHNDKVYHLGDVVINKKYLNIVQRLNGNKRLIRGNHDIFKTSEYIEAGFKEVYGVRVFVDKFILSHIPLHPACVGPRFKHCVHGHLHNNVINDPKYLNVSVEQINYTPLHFDEVLDRIELNEQSYKASGQVISFDKEVTDT